MRSKWIVAREHATDVGTGTPELGYIVLVDSPLFDTSEQAIAAIKEAGLPLGWVCMRVSQLLRTKKDQ